MHHCIVHSYNNEVPTSDAVVVELCKGPLNADNVLSTWLEDLEQPVFYQICQWL